MSKISFEEVYSNEYIRDSVNVFTDRLIRRFPVLKSSQDDIQQDFWIYINRSLEQYDETQSGIQTFIRNVMEKKAANICRHYFNFNYRISSSVGNIIENDESIENGYDPIPLQDLQMDLADIISHMSDTQKNICHWLMEGYSFREIARKMNISEVQLRRKHISPIRTILQKENFQEIFR